MSEGYNYIGKRYIALVRASDTTEGTTSTQAQLAMLHEKAERRRLDDQIAAANPTTQMPKFDAETLAKEMEEKTKNFSPTLPTMPKHLLREWLASVVSDVIVDMETKSIEIHVQLPKHMLESAFSSENAMRLVPTSASSTSYETHPQPFVTLGISDCRYVKRSNAVCFDCRRRRAA